MNKHLLELGTEHTCTWIGEGEGCSQPTVAGRNYCEHHLWLVYKQGTAIRRRKDQRTADTVRLWQGLMEEAIEELMEEGFLD